MLTVADGGGGGGGGGGGWVEMVKNLLTKYVNDP